MKTDYTPEAAYADAQKKYMLLKEAAFKATIDFYGADALSAHEAARKVSEAFYTLAEAKTYVAAALALKERDAV